MKIFHKNKTEVQEEQVQQKKPKKKKKRGKIIVFILILIIIAVFVVAKVMGSKSAVASVKAAQVLTGDITQKVETSGVVETEESKTYFADTTAKINLLPVKTGQAVKTGDELLSYDVSDLENSVKQAELEAKASTYSADATIIGINDAQNKAAEASVDYDDAVKYVAHFTDCVNQLNSQIAEATKLTEQQTALQEEIEKLEAAVKADATDKQSAKELKAKTKELTAVAKKLAGYDVASLQSALESCSSDLAEYKALKEGYEQAKETDPAAGTQKAQQQTVKESATLSEELAQQKLDLAKEGITAEFDGIVTKVSAVEGQTTAEGMELLTVENSKKVKAAITVSKYDLEKLAVGQKAVITINGKEYTGEVSYISRVAEQNQSGAVVIATDVHIDNPDDQIYLGIEAKVSIDTAEEKNALLVPISSVNYDTDGVFCYVVEDGKVVRKVVETGLTSDEYIQILSGVKKGDTVITQVTTDITEGMTVIPIME